LHHLIRIGAGAGLLIAGIWLSGRFGLSRDDKLALGKTARRLRLL